MTGLLTPPTLWLNTAPPLLAQLPPKVTLVREGLLTLPWRSHC